MYTRISRSVIDVYRDLSGSLLYLWQGTTELCPMTAFDGDRYRRHAPAKLQKPSNWKEYVCDGRHEIRDERRFGNLGQNDRAHLSQMDVRLLQNLYL